MTGGLMVREALLLLAAASAGAVNSVAGGGTLITFPTLVWLGLGSISANATSTVGLVPGAFSAAWGYRQEVKDVRSWLAWVIPPSLVGGILGAFVLTHTPQAIFDRLVPFLVLGATVLFMLNEPILRHIRRVLGSEKVGHGHRWAVAAAQFGIASYGGYFGAGMGILMLAALGLLELGSIHKMNALKTLAGAAINGVASALFIARGLVHWPDALTMIVGSILGGYFGADGARRLGQRTVRRVVVAIGLIAAVTLGARQLL